MTGDLVIPQHMSLLFLCDEKIRVAYGNPPSCSCGGLWGPLAPSRLQNRNIHFKKCHIRRYTLSPCIVLYCIIFYCIVFYCIVLYCIVLYCIVLYCIVLYCP